MSIFNSSRFDWINQPIKVPKHLSEGYKIKDYGLSFPVQKNWDEKDKRLLIVVTEVASADIKVKALCGSTYGDDLSSVIMYAVEDANLYSKVKLASYALAVVNFNSFPTYKLNDVPNVRVAAEELMAARVETVIKELEPTHILVMGDTAASYLIPNYDVSCRGWVENVKVAGKKVTVGTTLDLSLITSRSSFSSDEDDDEEREGDRDLFASAGLVETVIRNTRNIFLSDEYKYGNPHSIDVTPKWKFVDNIKDFDKMISHLKKAKYFACDTETRNLNRIENSLLVMQFACAGDDFAYIVPYKHRETPFSSKELNHIRKEVYNLLFDWDIDPFGTEGYIVGCNLQYDVIQLKEQLRIPLITRPLWDIQNGDYLLDENQCRLDSFAGNTPKAYSLAALALRYGCEAFLEKEGFNKSDREDMWNVSLNDKSFLDYCALDCLVPLAIHDQQLKRAEVTGYSKYKNLCLIQQGNNEHAVSCMEHRGVLLDIPYLKNQLKKGSDFDNLIRTYSEDMHVTDGVKEVNRILSNSMAIPQDSLFGGDVETADLFNPSKGEHCQILFSDVLDLEPTAGFQKKERPNGKPAIKLGKAFQHAHRFVREVALFTRLSKLKKMKSAYIEAFIGWVEGTNDGAKTGRMRPSFGFIYVVTGRSNSSKPSLQQTPSRGGEAKIIKRAFIAPKGHLRLATDYSANEVRFGANISRDKTMAEPFNIARRLRKTLFNTDNKERLVLKELKRRGINPDKETE